jgi:hypothetical protein
MSTSPETTVHTTFLSPVFAALACAQHARSCPSLPDHEWLGFCVMRALEQESSGRGFLQLLHDRNDRVLPSSTYFDSNATPRRLKLLREIGQRVCNELDARARDPEVDQFATVESLRDYDIYAGDGHYLAAATHDEPIDGTRRAVGHFFGLSLRTHSMFPMTVAERGDGRKREHDMRALKRLEIDALRRGAPRGRKAVWVWDRAGIDATQWQRWKQNNGIYFVSRAKDNMKLEPMGDLPYDAADPINRGVTGFSLVAVGNQALRCVRYCDPATGTQYVYLTSLTTIEPGVIAALYKARWDIEKVFDETKRKLGEEKSWGSSDETRAIQAETTSLTHNLMVLFERQLHDTHGLQPEDDAKRREERCAQAEQAARERGAKLSPLVRRLLLKATQRGLRFIRWLRHMIARNASLALALPKLRAVWRLDCG